MNLVIVESPSKAKTINKYLGKEYKVMASKGHVVDLPKSKISVDTEKNFEPVYEVTKKKVLSDLKKAYKEADKLVLAVDLDREGEAIAWHIAQKLGAIDKKGKEKKGHEVERIIFSEITEDAIEEAIAHPKDLNMDLIDAQQARRVLDRLVGYKLSPILWKKIAFGLSAGRVQSVALRLVVEKEDERRKFKPEEYWSIELFADPEKKTSAAKVNINLKEKEEHKHEDETKEARSKAKDSELEELIRFELSKIDGKKAKIEKEAGAKEITDQISDKLLLIKDVEKKVKKRYPKPPFITSTLQQTAVNSLGYSSKKTMTLAQKLYEKGFITYMRTDSVSMSKQAIGLSRSQVKTEFGAKYLPEQANAYKTKSKAAQEAHECIRPVDFALKEHKDMDPDMLKIYRLIRGRALGSQMVPAQIETNSLVANAKGVEKYEFRANGARVIFDGFLKATKEKVSENVLPEIDKGKELGVEVINANQHFTQPPARYSEASLIKKLEELGIGRPSTYSSIISTIMSRKYVEKEGRYLFPTTKGEVVNKLLVKYFGDIVDYGFTADMEDNLDKIAEGKLDWVEMMREFYDPFEKNVEKRDKEIPRDEFTVLGKAPDNIKCPVCGKSMLRKLSRYGEFYSCSDFPNCKGMLSIDGKSDEDMQKKAKSDEFKKDYLPAPKTEDGREYLLKNGRYGEFWAHPDYPKVKDAKPLEYTPEKKKELFGDAPKAKDGKEMELRSGRYGYFWAHPNYPEVKEVVRIKKTKDKE